MSIQIEWVDWTAPSHRPEIRRKWDDLFERSTARQPTSRFEQIELWFDTFAPAARREVLVAEENGRWLAAVPLMKTRLYGMIPTWEVPYSFWTPSPEILIDAQQHRDPGLIGSILHGLMRNGRWLVRAQELLGDSSVVNELRSAIKSSSYENDWQTRYEIGKVPVRGPDAPADWNDYQRQLSANFRRNLRKTINRVERDGGVELVAVRPNRAEEAERCLRAGFELEDRGWKGENGSSVMRSQGMLEFFSRQASLLAARSNLIVLNLFYQGQLIAFEYGYRFKRTYFSPKVAYDENHARISPGHLLMHLWIEQMYSEDEFDCYDFTGPITEATAKWAISTYPIVRLMAGTGPLGNQLLRSGRLARNGKRTLDAALEKLKRPKHESPIGVPAEANG